MCGFLILVLYESAGFIDVNVNVNVNVIDNDEDEDEAPSSRPMQTNF
jgi:hypothetical protein